MEKKKSKECLCCGKELTGRQEKYCSKKCKDLYRSIDVNIKEKTSKRGRVYRAKNKKRIRGYDKQYKKRNKDKLLEYNTEYGKRYRVDNKEKIAICNKEYNQKNKELIRSKKRVYERKRYKEDFMFVLKNRMSASINNHLRSNNLRKNGRHWEHIVGYTLQDLKDHLENLFQPGMTWGNRGLWQIDHIIPKSFFVYTSTDDVEFKYCWSLDNLQPLWAKENLSKGSCIIKKYLKSE